jgi:MerR family transcriptional regulator, light-induced transcriptional regulator
LRPIQPQILMFSANRVQTAENLANLPQVLENFPQPHPIIILGGQAFTNMHLPDSVPAMYLNMAPTEIVQRIEDVMLHSVKAYSSISEAGSA